MGIIGCGVNGAWSARCLAVAGFGPGVCSDLRDETDRDWPLWISVDQDDDNVNRRIGSFTPVGGPPVEVFRPLTGDNESEFFVARAKLNFKFGTY